MKLGYCISCEPDALREAGAERVWVDHSKSGRAERADLFTCGMRRGDTIILLSRSDLGRGKEIARFEALAAEAGVTIEIHEPKKPSRLKPGPAPAFQPNYRQEKRIRHYWHGPFKPGEALRVAAEEMGHPITRNSLNRHLGTRSKPRPWINKPPKGDD